MALGEVAFDDASYAGETGESVWSLQYYRNKAAEFQAFMEAVDTGARVAEQVAYFTPDTPDELAIALDDYLIDYESRKGQIRLVADGINAAASAINAVGGRFPVLSVPQGLAAAPFIIPAAAVAAFATAAALIAWGAQWLSGVNERLLEAQRTEGLSPEQLQTVELARVQITAAREAAGGSPLAVFAGSFKWLAIAVGAYVVWQAVEPQARTYVRRARTYARRYVR